MLYIVRVIDCNPVPTNQIEKNMENAIDTRDW